MKKTLPIILALIAIGLAAAAIVQIQIGPNYDPAWGKGRVLLLTFSVLFGAVGALGRRGTEAAEASPVLGRLRAWRDWLPLRFIWAWRVQILLGLCTLAAIGIYTFFGSTGTWTKWPETSQYYDDLATAFRAGRLNLNLQPSPGLLALADPYKPSLRNSAPGVRAFVDTVWDLTFYEGKFYMYWGPAPGMLLALLKLGYTRTIEDQYLAFAFLGGLLIFNGLLLLRLRGSFQTRVPTLLVVLGFAVTALAYPIPWMLSHAAIYEVSIAASQFFLIGGIYFAYRGLEHEAAPGWLLFLASVLWTLAVASRLVTILAVLFMRGTSFLWAIGKNRARTGTRNMARTLCTLGVPLLIGLTGLGVYNWLRFGSIFETGVRYMLTSVDLSHSDAGIFSGTYAASNLRLYLAGPMLITRGFPFIWPKPIPAASLLSQANIGIYHVEQMTGLFYAVPFTIFAVLSVLELRGWAVQHFGNRPGAVSPTHDNAVLWLTVSLMGASALSFAALLLYFYVAIRFLADVVPSLLLLSVLGVWQGYAYLKNRPAGRRLFTLAVIILGVLSIVVSLLLTMAESYPQFKHYNPLLLRQILLLFAHR